MEPPSLHGADIIDEPYDRELAARLPPDSAAALGEVNAAIERIEQGKYGICEATGRRIANPQLQAMPWRRLAPGAPARSRGRARQTKSHASKKN